MKNSKTKILKILLILTVLLIECKKEGIPEQNSKNSNASEMLSEDETILSQPFHVINFNFYLDGLLVPYETIDSVWDDILYSDFPDTSNVYCFRSLPLYSSYLTLNPNKESILKDIHVMDSIAATIPDSLDDEITNKPKDFPSDIALLNGSFKIQGYDYDDNYNPGEKVLTWFSKLNLQGMNNRVSAIYFTQGFAGSHTIWCTRKNFKGQKSLYYGLPFFGGYYALSDVRWNNNFMSVY